MNDAQNAETSAGPLRSLWLDYKERSDSPRLARRYLWCRLVGHRPIQRDQFTWECSRCWDTLPEGNIRRQP